MSRLTKEREAAIRENLCLSDCGECCREKELLAEIDALREENAIWEKHGLCPVSYTHLDVYKRQSQ